MDVEMEVGARWQGGGGRDGRNGVEEKLEIAY